MKNYRESYNMFCCNGILFNHESERRGETFVTRKITLAAARIAQGYQDKLYLGNLNSLRDWGYAKDYIECMWLILQQPEPDDFVIATGEYHTVREFATLAFKEAGIELEWRGDGVDERGICVKTLNPQLSTLNLEAAETTKHLTRGSATTLTAPPEAPVPVATGKPRTGRRVVSSPATTSASTL